MYIVANQRSQTQYKDTNSQQCLALERRKKRKFTSNARQTYKRKTKGQSKGNPGTRTERGGAKKPRKAKQNHLKAEKQKGTALNNDKRVQRMEKGKKYISKSEQKQCTATQRQQSKTDKVKQQIKKIKKNKVKQQGKQSKAKQGHEIQESSK